jgi:ABC-2 type transport system ATP-binding protein
LPDQAGVYQDMTVREFLEFFADAFLLKGAAHRAAVERAMQFSGLTARSDSTVEELSLGMKQRQLLAKTLLHGPKVLLLDEPATGLDPMARIDLREQLKALQAEGVTILISSHILSDLEDICTRIALIAAGRNANDGEGHSVIQLRAVQEPALLYEVDFLENGVAPADVLGTLAGVRVVRSAETQLLVEISGGAEQAARVLRALISAGLDITRFNSHPVGLEERYRVAFEGRHR